MNYQRAVFFILLVIICVLLSKYNPTIFSPSTLIIIIGLGLIYKNEMRQLFRNFSPVIRGSSNIANEEKHFFNYELFIQQFKKNIREIHTLLIDHNNCCKVKYTIDDPHEWTHFTSFLNNFSNNLISIVYKSQNNINHHTQDTYNYLLSDFNAVKENLFQLFQELEIYLMNSNVGKYAENNFIRIRKDIVTIVNTIDKNLHRNVLTN